MIIKSIAIIIALSFSVIAGFAGSNPEKNIPAPGKKYLLVIADCGGKPIRKDVLSALEKNPNFKITIAWQSQVKLPDEIMALEKERAAEIALSFAEEPLMPLIYDTEISSPTVIKFSWQEDVWNMMYRANEEFRLNTQGRARGIYLRSGVFSEKLIDGLKKQGISWANSRYGVEGVFIKDNFLIIAGQNKEFKNSAECLKWISSAQEQFVPLVFGGQDQLTPEIISAISGYIKQNDNVKSVTPELILSKLKDKVPEAGDKLLEPDLSEWLASPLIWYELSVVRNAVEDYKNSGSADVRTLEKLKEGLYKLYNYELISALIKNTGKQEDEIFQKDISNIYSLLKLPVDENIKSMPVLPQSRKFSVVATPRSLTVTNSVSTSPGKNINQFVVNLTSTTVTYIVDLDTSVVKGLFIVDIYIDLNNQEGAGLTKLLPGLNGFVETADAWEYAIRIDKDKASLFRAGRFDPVQINQFAVQAPCKIQIPRSLLRGNPLQWGYQAVTAIQQEEGVYSIKDFLINDNGTRQTMLSENPIQLPSARTQIKKE
jgi:hypothetical protein